MANDPFSFPDPFDFSSAFDLSQPTRRRRKPRPELTPDEESTLLSTLGNSAIGGLGYVGGSLDKPGRFVRNIAGLLTGAPTSSARELLSILPYSDTLGLTDETHAVSGRDLLEHTGMLDRNQAGLDTGDVAGFGLEMAMDPLTYLTGGLTAAGKTAKAVGVLGDTAKVASRLNPLRPLGKRMAQRETVLNDVLGTLPAGHFGPATPAYEAAVKAAAANGADLAQLGTQPLRKGAGLKVPFTSLETTFDYPGSAFVAHGLDTLGAAAKASGPGRAVRMLFDPAAGGVIGKHGQEVSELAYENMKPAQRAALTQYADASEQFDDVYKGFADSFGGHFNHQGPPTIGGMTEAETAARKAFSDIVRFTAESNQGHAGAQHAFSELLPGMTPTPKLAGDIHGLAKSMVDANDAIHRAAEHLGGNVKWIEETDQFRHFPRFLDDDFMKRMGEAGKGPRVLGTSHDGMKARSAAIRELPQAIVNRVVQDPLARQIDTVSFDSLLQRIEEPGVARATMDKPHGVYTNPAAAASLHEDLGGDKFFWRKNPGARVLSIQERNDPSIVIRRGAFGAGAGVWALRELTGTAEFNRLKDLSFADLRSAAQGQFPSVDWRRYYDRQEILEALGGMRARQAGFDAFELIGRTPTDTEFVGLTDRAMTPHQPGGANHILANYRSYLRQGDPAQHAKELADWADQKSMAFVNQGKDLFTRGSLDDFLKYQVGAHKAVASLEAVHELFRRNLGTTGIPLSEAFSQTGMKPEQAIEAFAHKFGIPKIVAENARVPAEVASAAVGHIAPYQYPEWATHIGQSIDKVTQIFKNAVTLPFPSFWARNLTSGQYVNLTSNLMRNPRDLAAYAKAAREAWGIGGQTGAKRVVTGGQTGANDRELLREMLIQGVVKREPGVRAGDVGHISNSLSRPGYDQLPGNPLSGSQTLHDARQSVADNPFALDSLPGGKAARTAYKAVEVTGSKVSEQVEWMNRVPMFIYLRRHLGWTPEAAAEKVKQLQFDYSDIAAPERSVMKRLVPFYSYTRKAIPQTVLRVLERPGGPLAQAMKASARGRDPSAQTPDYVSETAAINMGQQPDGSLRYLAGFGLPFEDPLSFIGGGLKGAGLEMLSRMNPMVKAPLEYAAGQSFFQKGADGGRALDDLDPMVGRLLANVTGQEKPVTFPGSPLFEHIIANSPASRAISTARTVTDPRKRLFEGVPIVPDLAGAMNLLTGMRAVDVSPASQDAILRERSQKLMKQLGAKSFAKVFFPEEEVSQMSPQEQADAIRLGLLQTALANRSKERKATKERKSD